MATIYRADGTQEEVQPANGRDFKLKEVQEIVGGYVEVLKLKDGRIMILNEEGKLIDLPRNEAATKLADRPTEAERKAHLAALARAGIVVIDASLEGEDYIAGDVLVCKNREFR